ncbi:MAG: TetR family transcriptional regulator [Alphaproteobacteria bacterium HGW-Alphaproteobacteria-5]|nr:MAG: TetR family transcriptional regulator [Alphaproteobacteria bacterium HGW-Alphaproteobacteria-5]
MADISTGTAAKIATKSADAAPDRPGKRAQIIAGARRAFLAAGYEAASMSLVAREAGVSKGTLYVYFTNKEALFAAVVEAVCRQPGDSVFDMLAGPGTAAELLPAFGRRFVAFILSRQTHELRWLVAAEARKFPELGRSFYEAGPRQGTARLAAFLKRRVEAGELDIDDTVLAASQFMGLCQAELGLMRQMNVIETATPQRIGYIVERAVQLFLDGYRPHR